MFNPPIPLSSQNLKTTKNDVIVTWLINFHIDHFLHLTNECVSNLTIGLLKISFRLDVTSSNILSMVMDCNNVCS